MAVPLANRTEPIPGYKLLERLGRGGFGEVWKCEAPGGIHKAIKFVYGELDTAGDDGKPAEQEHKALDRVKQVRHPFILSLERYDVIDHQLVIVMELADRNLHDRFRECRAQGLPGIPREELLRYVAEAAEALDLMNNQYNLQHLDIKPQNLFLVHSHVKVADFGLVKDLEGLSASVTGGVTPVYAAPETFEGRVSRFSDQYSLGIVYQELLTGQRPFSGTNTKQLVLQHLTQPPDLAPLPEGDRGPIGRALAKKPDERFPTCTALVAALRGARPAAPAYSNGAPPAAALTAPPLTVAPVQTTSSPVRLRPPAPPGQKPKAAHHTQQLRAPLTIPRPPDVVSVSVSQLFSGPAEAPPERTGDGVLRPALVFGAGYVGNMVLRRLRAAIDEQFGAAGAAPHVKLLAFETDADDARKLAAGRSGALPAKDVIVARLQRPAYYLQKRDGVPLEGWLDSQLVYRMPRNPTTDGQRPLGRLAFCDHFYDVRDRLRAALVEALDPAALAEAEQQSKLGLRTNRPVVYVAANPAGGTGGGTVLDLAYLVRAELRRLGYDAPEVVGVLLVPPADRAAARSPALANTYATLAELAHYSAPDTEYKLSLGPREPPVVDAAPPLSRCLLVQLPSNPDSAARRQAVSLAAGLVYRDLFTPLGRAAAAARADRVGQRTGAGPVLQAASAYRLTWPVRRLLRRSATLLAVQLLRAWTAKDNPGVRAPVQAWIEEQWTARQLVPDMVIDRLHAACAAAIGVSPDAKFEALVGVLDERIKLGGHFDAPTACQVLDGLADLIGRPPKMGEDEPANLLETVLEQTANAFGSEYEQKLAEMAVHFVELPQYRLAAAEEVVRQLTERLRQVLATYEGLYKTLEREGDDCFIRLMPLIGTLGPKVGVFRKGAAAAAEVLELLHIYPKKRYQMLVARCVLSVYRSMLNTVPEYLREVNFCRQRVGEAVGFLEKAAADDPAGEGLGPGQDLFPGGDRTVEEAAARVVVELTPEEWVELDGRIQAQVRKQFRSVITLCLEGTSPAEPLAKLVRQQAADVLAARLGQNDPASVFFQHHPDQQAAQRDVAKAFDEAQPELTTAKGAAEVTLLAVPPGTAGELFRALARAALPGEDLAPADCADEIVFYREHPALAPADVPQLGPIGREAYQHALATQQSPHARIDVTWKPVGR
jgi:serine/threonine protein kinase